MFFNSLLAIHARRGAQASDVADRSMHQGFLSQYMASDASKTSLAEYNKFVIPRLNHMEYGGAPDSPSHHSGPAEHGSETWFGNSADPKAPTQDSVAFTSVRGEPLITKDANPPKIIDKEEERAVQKVLANDKSMPIGMSAIGVSLLVLAAMLGVRMRRELQQAAAFARSVWHESDMSIALAPAAAGNILELNAQESVVIGQVGWSQQSPTNSCPSTFCYATPSAAADEEEDDEESESTEAPYLCYLLRSATGRRTYTGVTIDLRRRLQQHNGLLPGGARATRMDRPWTVLCATSGFASKGDALRFEWRLKRRRAVNSKKLIPMNGGMVRRCQNVYEVLNLERWTQQCRPASETLLKLTWYDSRWLPSNRSLPSYVTEEKGSHLIWKVKFKTHSRSRQLQCQYTSVPLMQWQLRAIHRHP